MRTFFIITTALFISTFVLGAEKRAQRAPAKPLDAYEKQVTDRIQELWSRYTQQNISVLDDGTLRMNFRILADGHVKGLRITSNTSNDKFAEICTRAVKDSSFPPVPDAVRNQLGHDYVQFRNVTFSFSPEAGGSAGSGVKVPR